MAADHRLRYAVLAGAAVAIGATHATLVGYATYANVDEAYAAALAKRVLDGHRLYEGAISQRGPLMYYVYAFIARTVGWDNVVGLRLWMLAISAAAIGLTAWAGTKLFSHRAGSVAAAILSYIFVAGLPPMDGIALHGETMQSPLLLLGSVLAFLAVRPVRRRGLLLAAGTLFGAAVAIKPSVVFQPLPVVLLVLASARRGRRSPWPDLVVFVAGIVAVLVAFLVHAAAQGTLGALYYYCFTYNLSIHLRPGDALLSSAVLVPLARHVQALTVFVGIIVAMLAAAIPFVFRRVAAAVRERSGHALLRGFGARGYIVAHALTAVAGASTMVRFFPHYFLPSLPFVALAIAAWVSRLRMPRLDLVRAAALVVTVTSIIAGGFNAYAYEKLDGEVAHGPLVKRVARYIEVTTSADASIFVWGFSPWLHEYAHRKPAGRYVFETYVTGFVPWFFDAYRHEKERTVPGSLASLLADLDREKPEVVVDAGSVLIARPMRAYPLAAAFLHAGYCFEIRVGGYDVYRRRTDAGCASEVFPKARGPVDYMNVPMGVTMPVLVDDAEARPLCASGDDDPLWFPGAPPPAAGLAILQPGARAREVAENRAAGVATPRDLRPAVDCRP